MKKRRVAIIVSEGTAKLFPDAVVDGCIAVFEGLIEAVAFEFITAVVDVFEGITAELGAVIAILSAIIDELIAMYVELTVFGANIDIGEVL